MALGQVSRGVLADADVVMASLFDLRCEMENYGADFQEGLGEGALRERLKTHKRDYANRELSSVSADVAAGFMPSNCTGPSGVRGVQHNFGSLLKELEEKSFDHAARNIDVFFLGHKWGEHFENMGELQTAETFYAGALQAGDCPAGRKALSQVYGKRDMVAVVQQYLGLLYKKQKKFDKAEQMYFKVLDTPAASLVMSTLTLHQLSNLYLVTGDAAKLRNAHKRWKKLLVAHKVPEDTLIYCQYHDSRADFLRTQREFKEAVEHREQAMAIYESAYGADSWLLNPKLVNLAKLSMDQFRFEPAYARLERAQKICSRLRQLTEAEKNSCHPFVPVLQNPVLATTKQQQLQAQTLAAMGDVRSGQRRNSEALALFERAFRMDYDKADGNMGVYMQSHGHVLKELGRFDEALDVMRRASAHLDRTFGNGYFQSVVARCALGEALLEAHRFTESKTVLEKARSLALASLGPSHRATQDIEDLLRVVTHSLETGSIPFSLNVPTQEFSEMYRPPEMKPKCESCEKREQDGEKFKVCSKCKRVKYCSVECQKEDWKQHKKKCRPLPI
ncbi:hypothetical protein KFL_002720150 [Klebsormidium nitens]|uniref:MYND-type domain-containing protein n=1 Tax=Klebsormidium nitens TaxID=105231 RepID=A0A1Y1IAI9_KLENI|nr:hypothetical protein KFL_002720150 [Klebsormidium nitens]|eukprot:GAQ86141.1 hypothetical protein KFL_002720150 [Klebsormidium nitens]